MPLSFATMLRWLPLAPGAGLVVGLGLLAFDAHAAAGTVFALATATVLAALLWQILRGVTRGEFGLDLIAALSMAGALALGEYLAGAVIALMFAGGEFLEARARARARQEMTALLSRLPRHATRHGQQGLEEVPLAALRPGDQVLVRKGEVVPVDGSLASAAALLDLAALTGEPLPVACGQGDTVLSGSTNAGEPFELIATHDAAASTYAGIVRLVEGAQQSKAPMARLAEGWAMAFLALTLAIAALAWWLSGDARRVLSVLVVATPCPLILAVPVAIIAGMSRAAGIGVLVKNGAALEALGRARVLLLDKTGTLTDGRATLVRVLPAAGFSADEVLRLAASLDQASGHVIAATLVAAAREAGLSLAVPDAVQEVAGAGLAGEVEGRRVAVGGPDFVRLHDGGGAPPLPALAPGQLPIAVAVDGAPAGLLLFADTLRPDATALLQAARAAGIQRIELVSGDRADVAAPLAAALGLDAVRADCTPPQKVAAVQAARAHGPVLMLGDGVNDAPALAAADIGMAMGARGAAASAEAADAVVLVDRLDRVADAMRIARRATGIARQSVLAGIGLSVAGMLAAAAGLLTPVQGAVLQEAIDVAVILNALRALRD